MSRSYPTHSEYSESSIEWLGKMPTAWTVTALKHGYSVTLGKMLQPEPRDRVDELLPYLRAANIQWGGVDTSNVKSMWLSPKERATLRLEEGDLLVSEGGDVGRCCVWNRELPECYIQNSINRVRSVGRNSNRFLYYWLLSLKEKDYIDVICSKSTIAYLTVEKLEQIPVPMPIPAEQTQIAAFLDYETANIDALIEKQQQLIALLKEKRQAVISHAVTKGLNPDAPMRDSGVEWLGEVPAHWEVGRYKNIFRIDQGVAFKSSEYVADSNVVSVRMGNIKKGGRLDLDHKVVYLPSSYKSEYCRYQLSEDDLIIAMTDFPPSLELLAVPARMSGLDPDKVYLLNQRVGKLILNAKCDPEFVRYVLLCDSLRSYLKAIGLGTVHSPFGQIF